MSARIGNFQLELENTLKTAKLADDFPSDLKSNTENVIFKILSRYARTKDIQWISVYLENCHRLHCKSREKAGCCKSEGNKFFQKKLYNDAVSKYTEAVISAPDKTEDLAFAYGNRSAAVFRLGLYQECLTDIEEAIQCGYPLASRHKLILRKAQCLSHLEHTEETRKCLEALKESLSSLELDPEKQDSILKEIKKIEEKKESSEISLRHEENDEVPAVSYGSNPVLVQASSAVTLECNETNGRFLTALRDVKAGDTLIVERPFAAVLLPDHYPTHCHHCFQKLHILYPCRQCTLVRYCSARCAASSWVQYHSVECRYLQLLHSVGIAHLSLRIVLVAGLEYLLDFVEKEKRSVVKQELPGLDEDGQYKRNYRTVYDLMTHSDDMSIDDLFQYTMTAKLLLEILRHSGWFSSEKTVKEQHNTCANNCSEPNISSGSTSKDVRNYDTEFSEKESCIGGLLLRHILQLVCNAHAITELQCSQSGDSSIVEEKSQVRIATAIYPTASLMNHSCDPTIISSFCKDTLVVRAVKDLHKGEEIFNCYGPHFKRMGWSECQQCLKEQYFFDCHCRPCTEGEASEAMFASYRCNHCSGPVVKNAQAHLVCRNCDKEIEVDESKVSKGDNLFQKGLQLLQENNIKEAITVLRQCYENRKSVLYKHNKYLADVQDCLARCYAMSGDFKTSVKYLKESVHTVEVMFGENSVELANELQKLSESLIGAQDWKEALTANERACNIFEKSYGKKHEIVRELNSARNELLQVINS